MADDYIATEKLYLNPEGKIVGSKDPTKRTLFMLPGGKMARSLAEMHGLIKPEAEVVPEPEPAPAPVKAPAKAAVPKVATKIPQPVASASPPVSAGEPQAGVDKAS